MLQMQRGQKAKITDLTADLTLEVVIEHGLSGGGTLDVSCFGLDSHGRLSDDRYFIFYNQETSPCGALAFLASTPGKDSFRVDLSRLPQSVRRLVFTASLDGTGTLSKMTASKLTLHSGSNQVAQFSFSGTDFAAERAVMIGEIYFKDVWRLAAVGQGFAGGLSALLAHFGGEEVVEPATPTSPPVVTPPPPPRPPLPPPPIEPVAPSVKLTKVTLQKKGSSQTVSLSKGTHAQPIHINLNWDNPNAKRPGMLGVFGGGEAPDLDLGCMFELTDGSKGVIQPLGENFGSRTHPPYIFLDKDDRSGASTDGENLYITRPDLVKRIMVFSLIYDGAANYATVNGRLRIKDHQGNEILVPLNNPDPAQTFCSICLIERSGTSVSIRKDELYFRGHDQADGHYGFGFRWVAGKK